MRRRSSKPVRRRSPTLGRFDSGAAPLRSKPLHYSTFSESAAGSPSPCPASQNRQRQHEQSRNGEGPALHSVPGETAELVEVDVPAAQDGDDLAPARRADEPVQERRDR